MDENVKLRDDNELVDRLALLDWSVCESTYLWASEPVCECVCVCVCVSLKLIIVEFRARLSMIVSTTYGIPFLFVSVHCRDASLHSTLDNVARFLDWVDSPYSIN